jgi:hypothetical protein
MADTPLPRSVLRALENKTRMPEPSVALNPPLPTTGQLFTIQGHGGHLVVEVGRIADDE